MTRPFRELAELQALLDALCEESITPEQVRCMEGLVLTYPEAEARYIQFLSLHADLADHFGVLRARTRWPLYGRAGAGPGDGQTGRQGARETKGACSRFRFSLSGRLLDAE